MKDVELVIFDWDGTLMDSVARIVSCMQKAATECYLSAPEQGAIHGIIGLSLDVAMKTLHPQINDEQSRQLISTYSELYKFRDETPSPLFEGARELIQSLHQNGKKLAIATGKSRTGLERVLAETELGSFFITRRGADEAKSKPHPLMLQMILDELNLRPEQAVMIGDSVHDLAMANNIGMRSVGVTWGVDKAVDLYHKQPAGICHTLDELHQVLLAQ